MKNRDKKSKKMIRIALLTLIGAIYLAYTVTANQTGNFKAYSFHLNLNVIDVQVEISEWLESIDNFENTVFVLKLSPEVAQEILNFPLQYNETMPTDLFTIFIYIKDFHNGLIERVMGRVEIDDSTLRVYYRTDISTVEHTLPYHNYIGGDVFRGYELSRFWSHGSGISDLEIYIDGEKVEFFLIVKD